MTDNEQAVYDDYSETRQREMRKSLDVAIALWNFLGEVIRKNAGKDVIDTGDFKLLRWDEVDAVIEKEFGARLHKKRVEFLHAGMQGVILEYGGLDSCGLWQYAHVLDHGLFDDLSLL